MRTPPGRQRIRQRATPRQRALALLADCPDGHTDALMVAHGVTPELLSELVAEGLATANAENIKRHKAAVKIVRLRITEAGRKALPQ